MAEADQPSLQQLPPPESDLDNLVDYQRAAKGLFADLQLLGQHAAALGLNELKQKITEVTMRLESDRFSVAVVGEFKRGKSTFINALLGAEVLPTDVSPCSATLNRVAYGLRKYAVIDYRDGRQTEIPLEQLADHVTKLTESSEELAKTIARATVFYPSPYCKDGVDVLDTPGLNDDDSMTSVTLDVLPQVDAAILVIRAQAPFGEFERNFLETRLLSADLGRVLFVVNGIDQLQSASDADRVIADIRRRIHANVLKRAREHYGESSPEYERYLRKLGRARVFGLSAYEALTGRSANDPARFERSRFAEFERELQRFLVEQRGAVLLQVEGR